MNPTILKAILKYICLFMDTNVICIGLTTRHFNVRIEEHLDSKKD